MVATLEEKKKILQKLQDMPCGKIGTLKIAFKGDILPETVDLVCKDLGLIGVIKHGYDGLGHLRFNLTAFGKDYCNSLLSFTKTQQRLSRLIGKLAI